jgi:predicted nucleic acid-binding protein
LTAFPDINVWLALLMADDTHRRTALDWWDNGEADSIPSAASPNSAFSAC